MREDFFNIDKYDVLLLHTRDITDVALSASSLEVELYLYY